MGIQSANSADGTPTPPPHLHAATSASQTLEQTPDEAAAMSAEEKEREALLQACFDEQRRTVRERMTVCAELGEARKKYGHYPDIPPFEILEFPDLLERAWGWDSLLPCWSSDDWNQYKKYLQAYYKHNNSTGINDGDNGDTIATLAKSCIKVEMELMTLMTRCPKKFSDEINQSHKVTKCANEISKMKCCEFPAAAIALKCIMAEADLMCQCLISGCYGSIYGSSLSICGRIRQYALSFMMYKAPEHIAASATMMAATKCANFIVDLLKNEGHYKDDKYHEDFFWTSTLRDFALETMMSISDECSAAEESATDSNLSNLVFGESNDKNCSENDAVQNNNMQETEKTNQQKCSKEDCVEGSNLDNIAAPNIEEHVEELIQDNVMNHIKHQSEVDVSKSPVLNIPTDEEYKTSLLNL